MLPRTIRHAAVLLRGIQQGVVLHYTGTARRYYLLFWPYRLAPGHVFTP
jgi:hypothetical protein